MGNYKISVVTVTFNCESTVGGTIESVLAQTWPTTELIVIDGASRDGTMSEIMRYANRIAYIKSEPDNGIYDAMNKGILAATGDFVIFMNAGDSFNTPSALKDFVTQIEDDTIIAYGDIIKVGGSYRYKDTPAPLENMGQYMTLFHQATMTRLNYHKTHLFDISFRSAGDYDFFYKAYLKDHVKFQYIPVTLARFDCKGGTSNQNFRLSFYEDLRIWKREKDWLYRLRKELWFFSIDIKRWIKKHLMSPMQVDEVEKRRLRKMGYKL